VDCSPQGLIDLARCVDTCVPEGMLRSVQIATACAWDNGGPPPPPQFSYTPATDLVTWVESHGGGTHTGNLAFFLANAHFAWVVSITIANQTLTSISNLNLFPTLGSLDLHNNGAFAGPVDISGNPQLFFLWIASNPIAAVDISHNPLLTFVFVYNMSLSVLDVNTILAQLVTFGLTGGTCLIMGQTPAAPPSVGPPDGIAAKAALLAEIPAWTCTTD